jgi:hypothetical protein
MHQVKIFSGEEAFRDRLEQEINDWLASTKARVVSVTGNIAPQTVMDTGKTTRLAGADPGAARFFASSDILIIVVYETV